MSEQTDHFLAVHLSGKLKVSRSRLLLGRGSYEPRASQSSISVLLFYVTAFSSELEDYTEL